MMLLEQIRRFARRPRHFLTLVPRVLEKQLTPLFSGSAFHLQSQMEISPRSRWYAPHFVRIYGGLFPPGEATRRAIADLEPWDSTRRDMLVLLLRHIIVRGVPGNLAELGVYHGRTARLIHRYAPERTLHLFDTFEGFDERDLARELETTGHHAPRARFADTNPRAVLRFVAGGSADGVRVYPGHFPESCPAELRDQTFAFVHLDADLYEPTLAGLAFFYPRMPRGGVIVVHDYNAWPGARKAVDEFFSERSEIPVPMPDKNGSAVIIKQ